MGRAGTTATTDEIEEATRSKLLELALEHLGGFVVLSKGIGKASIRVRVDEARSPPKRNAGEFRKEGTRKSLG